jgi:nicotinate-nucleotide adenylyltransferase
MRIGIYGGTFNPPHNGHLITAEAVREQLHLDTVLFIPSAKPPHKYRNSVAPAHHRLAMTQLAVADNPRFQVSDIELKRRGKSYTITTLKQSFYNIIY